MTVATEVTVITVDIYGGKETMKEVHKKKYLGDIISDDMKNEKNLKEKQKEQ